MKRVRPKRDTIFNDSKFALEYIIRHRKMQENFGTEFSNKLKKKGFIGGRVLDAGCGFGETLIMIGNNFKEAELYGVDLSEVLLNSALNRAKEQPCCNRIRFQKADVHKLPFPDDHFDVIVNTNMIHVVDDPLTMLNEMERVLKNDGLFFIADLKRSLLGIFETEIKSAFDEDELLAIVESSQLRSGKPESNLLWWRYEN